MPTKPRQKKKPKTTKTPKPTKKFAVALVSNLPAEVETDFTNWLFSKNCLGTEEVLDFSQDNLRYEPSIVNHARISLKAYFEPLDSEKHSAFLSSWLNLHAPEAGLQWVSEPDRDWLKEWKKHFKSFDVGGFRVEPAWEKPVHTEKLVLRIEPGMAFGTGTHPTTRFALELLEEQARRNPPIGRRVLDVGAGSGILSVAAERLGARHVDALDNDASSWRVCRANFAINKTTRCSLIEKQVGEMRGGYDLVVANIIDGVLVDIGRDLRRLVKKRGHLILSGILSVGMEAFKKSFFEGGDFEILSERQDAEWAGILARKKG